jgi:hypothetical protein
VESRKKNQGKEDAGVTSTDRPETACPSNHFTGKTNFVLKVY